MLHLRVLLDGIKGGNTTILLEAFLKGGSYLVNTTLQQIQYRKEEQMDYGKIK